VTLLRALWPAIPRRQPAGLNAHGTLVP
jgi:hypothetical protein